MDLRIFAARRKPSPFRENKPKIFPNKIARSSIFIFEGRRTVTERALARESTLMAWSKEDALEIAVREHARLVYRVAYSVLRNHHDAEDATQETFLRALRYRRKLEGVREAKTWLASIAWRVAVGRAKKRPEVSLSDEMVSATAAELRSQLKSAEEFALGNEMADLLTAMIASLPEGLRDALRLSTVDELSPAEIAEVLGTSEASVRSRLFRARQILKEKLAAIEGKHANTR
jgi:RNA polymerase sigma-70 factor, ECF subfamily